MLATELVPAAIVAASIGPPLLLLWLVVVADSRPEPARLVLGAVLFGALATIVAATLETKLKEIIPLSHNPWLAAQQNALFFAAIPEEALKIGIIALLCLRARDFDEPMDGVVYGAAVGLGFAALENILYVVHAEDSWQGVAVTRGVLSVPFHGALGVIAGAYLARARFGGALGGYAHDPGHRQRLLVLAFVVPVVLHSVFDGAIFSLSKPPNGTWETDGGALAMLTVLAAVPVIGFGTIIYAAVLARRIARHQKIMLHTKRVPPAHWRDVWAECLLGVGASFVALALVIAGNSGIRMVGSGLTVVAIGLAWKSGKHLNATAKRRHGSILPPPLPPS
jgi:RsiW-degrading membrane proteinase PrsW (M82 family)